MKQLILIFHMMSGISLEITDSQDVMLFTKNIKNSSFSMKGEFSSYKNGNKIHINMRNVEYIEEKIVESRNEINYRPSAE